MPNGAYGYGRLITITTSLKYTCVQFYIPHLGECIYIRSMADSKSNIDNASWRTISCPPSRESVKPSWNSNIPIIESVNKVITAESGKDTYDLGVNADEYMIISIQSIDRNGWIYTISRGVSGTEGTNNWSLCFVNNSPTGAFTFKIITLKIK